MEKPPDSSRTPRRPGKADQQADRERRLAEALRMNLRRRKEAGRAGPDQPEGKVRDEER